jgi:hypothetical protein
MVKGTFWKISKKIVTFQRKNVLRLPYLANRFNGSPKRNNIPKFYTSPFVL